VISRNKQAKTHQGL